MCPLHFRDVHPELIYLITGMGSVIIINHRPMFNPTLIWVVLNDTPIYMYPSQVARPLFQRCAMGHILRENVMCIITWINTSTKHEPSVGLYLEGVSQKLSHESMHGFLLLWCTMRTYKTTQHSSPLYSNCGFTWCIQHASSCTQFTQLASETRCKDFPVSCPFGIRICQQIYHYV